MNSQNISKEELLNSIIDKSVNSADPCIGDGCIGIA